MKRRGISFPERGIRLALACALTLLLSWFFNHFFTPAFARVDLAGESAAYLPIAWNGLPAGVTPTPSPPQQGSDWLDYLNYYRALAGLGPVSRNEAWGDGGWYHSRYMVKNDVVAHNEDPQNSWFTEDGNLAAQSSNLVASYSFQASDYYAIESWMQAPFHSVAILDPALRQVGFGSFREADGGLQMGATLDVIRGLAEVPPSQTFPIAWPADGMTLPFGSHWGEYPSPLSSCPGYAAPSGAPIILMVGAGERTPQVTAHGFYQGNKPLEHCVFDESSYVNSDPAVQRLGRAILEGRDAIILIPRRPLTAGATYTASITYDGQAYTWSFEIAEESLSLDSLAEPLLKMEFLGP